MNAKYLRSIYNLSEDSKMKDLEYDELLFLDIMYKIKQRAKDGQRFLYVSGLFSSDGINLSVQLEMLGFDVLIGRYSSIYSLGIKW